MSSNYRVIPFHKNHAKEDANNYRPISILPTISNVFEKHVANELHRFFQYTNIIHNTQSGFRKKHSCQTALIRLIDHRSREIDSGKMVGVLYLDLRKAFNTVNHELLLKNSNCSTFRFPHKTGLDLISPTENKS